MSSTFYKWKPLLVLLPLSKSPFQDKNIALRSRSETKHFFKRVSSMQFYFDQQTNMHFISTSLTAGTRNATFDCLFDVQEFVKCNYLFLPKRVLFCSSSKIGEFSSILPQVVFFVYWVLISCDCFRFQFSCRNFKTVFLPLFPIVRIT